MNHDNNNDSLRRARRRVRYDVLVAVLYLTGAIGGLLGFVSL